MSINNILDESYLSCTGCSACALICNNKAIFFRANSDGFYVPLVDESKCTNCGICKTVCYKYLDSETLKDYIPYKDGTVYAVINNYVEQMHTVSTAGVATVIAKNGFSNGKQIVGVLFDASKNRCYHHLAENSADIKGFMGSKYLQSQCFEAFVKILADKESVVFGTPCQIYGLRKVLQKRKMEGKVLLVDLFCAGVPSLNLWKAYRNFLERIFGLSGNLTINFRDKTTSWHRFSIYAVDENGNNYRQNLYNDIFFKFFLQKKCMNKSCYDCVFRCKNLVSSDIRLGDFWGEKFKDYQDGVELMVINTQKGETAWNEIKHLFRIEKCDIEDIFKSQRIGSIPIPDNYHETIQKLLTTSIELL